jgi:alpha-tubulin suppressor-like RCC1 family protein
MPGKFIGLGGVDLELAYVNDYAVIDEFARTGSMWLCGFGQYGRLGNNATTNRSSPVQTVSAGTDWKQVSIGVSHSVAIKTNGTLWTWGEGFAGGLGNNATTNRSSPVQTVSAGTNWKQAACGRILSAAIKTDGTLWLWGSGVNGELGNNATTNRSSPVQTISTGNNWQLVSVGAYHSAAIKTDGTLWLWGQNTSGKLGNNSTIRVSSPVQTIAGGTNWKQVSAGQDQTAAIKTDGTLWLWGNNGYGRLGDNTTVSKSSPVQTISTGTNWKQVSCGQSWTSAIKTDGTLWIWGVNGLGQLGDNTTVSKSSPVQTVSAGNNWKQVGNGFSHSSAIKTDGTLWLWGDNVYGQLGTNNTLARSSPVQTVSGGTNWKQVSAGLRRAAAIYFYDAGNLYPNS